MFGQRDFRAFFALPTINIKEEMDTLLTLLFLFVKKTNSKNPPLILIKNCSHKKGSVYCVRVIAQ